MARPRDSGDHHPVLAAADPWCRRLYTEAGVAKIEATPPTTPRALVVERTAATADRAPLPLAAFRAYVRHHAAISFLDQALQHTVHYTQNAEPYTPTRHVVSSHEFGLSIEIVGG